MKIHNRSTDAAIKKNGGDTMRTIFLAVLLVTAACGGEAAQDQTSGPSGTTFVDLGSKKTAQSTNIFPQPCDQQGCVGPIHVCVTPALAGLDPYAGYCVMICADEPLTDACFAEGGAVIYLTDGTPFCVPTETGTWP